MWPHRERADDNEAVETERWCAGLVSVGTAPMDAIERAGLVRWTRILLATALLVGLAATALLAWPFLPPLSFWERDGLRATLATAGLLVSWVLALPVAGLLAVDLVRRYVRHVRELLGGEVELFEGALDRGRLDPEQRTLLLGHAFSAIPGGGEQVRLFPRSCTVRYARRGRMVRWRMVRVRTVAAGPGYELRVVIPRESVGVSDPRVEILRRRMTADERREVLLRVARLRDAWKVLVLQVLSGVIVYGAIVRSLTDHAALAAVTAVTLFGWTAHRARRPVEAIRLARQLQRDAQAGLVLTHRRLAGRAAGDAAAAAEDGTSWVDVEFLPVSSLSWTVRGRPARWRDLMAPAWRVPFVRS